MVETQHITQKPLRVIHFARRPAEGAFSIERVFEDVRSALPPDISVTEVRNQHLSRGIIRRFKDAWVAGRNAGPVNHIVGDTHYLTAFLPRQSTILTVHDTAVVERAKGIKHLILWLFWIHFPLRWAGYVTAISHESRRRLAEIGKIDASRIEVIPNPVAVHFTPQPKQVHTGLFRLLHLGTKANKNLERLVSALDGLDVELTIVGRLTSHQQALLKRHATSYRQLHDLTDEALLAEYRRTDALIFVSLDEGFGLPILEAQAVHRVVITSARAPMSDVAGKGALFVDPESEIEIRSAVAKIMASPALCDALVVKGDANVSSYSAEAVAKRYADLYLKVASRTGTV